MFRFRPILFVVYFFLIISFSFQAETLAETPKVFKTTYTEIYYPDDNVLSDFFWRISGKRFTFTDDADIARSRVDGIIDRVQFILDMHPNNFRIKIVLYAEYKGGMISFYSHKPRTITVYAYKVTDGVFAHEIAHAVICNYFPEPPPSKIQEILAQYVNIHLWSDY